MSPKPPSLGRLTDFASRSRNWPAWGVMFGVLFFYIVASGGVLTATLLQLRNDALASGEKLVGSFAQMASEQTASVLQSVEQTLQSADIQLTVTEQAGTSGEEQGRAILQSFLPAQSFLRAIWVLDAQGRSLYDSDPGNTGIDFSDRAYFVYHRDQPMTPFRIGLPFMSRTTGKWTIPVTRGRRGANGEFAGVIVAAVEPLYFAKIWSFDDADRDISVALYRDDGPLLMRNPFDESALGRTFSNSVSLNRYAAGERLGRYRGTSVIDNIPRLLAFHQASSYPAFVVVGQRIEQALAPWWEIVAIVSAAWAVSLLALTGLSIWLTREWVARHDAVDRYRLLFDQNPYPAVVVDAETQRILAVNDTGIAQYGYTREEFLGHSCLDFHPPEEREAFLAEYGQSEAGVTRIIQGFKNVLKDGTVIDVELSTRVIEYDGKPAILAIAKNVVEEQRAIREQQAATREQQRALRELKQSEEKYRALADSIPVGIVETTSDGHIAAANIAWRQMFGFGETEDLSKVEVATLYADPQDREAVMARAQAGAAPDPETTFRRRDGTAFPAERHFNRVIDDNGKLVALRGIVIDITRRKLLETQLQQAQKMEAVGQLTGGIAHDFNNILAAILANIEALEDEEGLDPKLLSRLGRIGMAVQKAAELTRQLLAFSRRQPLHPKRMDINELVIDVSKLVRRTLGGQIEIDTKLADVWAVEIDRVQLEAALVNLCINARDAMPQGGRLVIETANAVLDEDYAALHSDVVPGDYAMLAVSDTGSGMPPEIMAKVFEPFFTTKGVGKGTGLGLSMVYGFVRQSRGHIHLYSEVGRGTTVKIYLPRSEGAVQKTAKPAKVELPRGGERILVVEDDGEVRAGVLTQLRSLGYDVSEAASGQAGVAAFDRAPQPFDLLLTDVVMPGAMNGKALAEEVAKRWPRTRIIFMSGYTETALTQEYLLGTNTVLLSKPFRRADLAQKIRQVLDAEPAGTT